MRHIYCWIIVFFLSANQATCAQDFKEAYVDPISPAVSVAWVDFDNDGDPDLATSGALNKAGEGATILYRNDNDQFVEMSETFGGITGKMKWLDFDVDGDLDLFLTGGNQIHIFKNTNGTFNMEYTFYTNLTGYYSAVYWADYELDGNEDMFVRNNEGISVWVKIGGTFQFKQLISRERTVSSFTVADFNLDGSVDILIKSDHYDNPLQGSIRLYLYNSTSAQYEIDKSNTFEYIPYSSPSSFDADDDGDPDLLFGSKLFINTAGSFALSTNPFFEAVVGLKELDGDGVMDVVSYEDGRFVYYKNETGGVYSKIVDSLVNEFSDIFSTAYYGSSFGRFRYACISGMVAPGINSYRATRIYRLENGSYRNIYPNPFDQSMNTQITWIDYDKDGLMDVFIANGNLYRNTGIGFEPAYKFKEAQNNNGSWVDFNNDGNLDFVNRVDRKVVLYEGFQNNPPKVTSKTIFSGVTYDSKIQVLDVDNDKDLDIYIDGLGGIYTNSNGVFTKTFQFESEGILGKSEWADYDLDGDMDVAIYIEKSILGISKVYLYQNTGTSFKPVLGTPFANLRAGSQCKWVDYNKDGYVDLFVYGEYYGKRYVYLYKNVAGVFTEQQTNAFALLEDIGLYNMQINIVDFDLNGFPDIIVNGNGASEPVLYVYRNTNGTFLNYLGHGLPNLWGSLDFADYDNDGDPDVILTGRIPKVNFPKTQIYINQIINLNSGPTVRLVFPANRQTLVYNNGYTLHIDFQQPVFKGSGSLRFYRKSNSQLLYEIQIDDPAISINGNRATVFINADPFDNGEQVYVLFDATAFTDAESKAGNGVLNQSIWNLTIQNNKTDQTISFPKLPSVLVGSPDLNPQATSSAGLKISYASSNESVATIKENLINIKSPGTTLITATSSGNAVFNSANPVSQTMTVSKATQIIAFPTISNKKIGDGVFRLMATASSGLDVLFSTSSPRVFLVGNEVNLLQAGPVTVNADQIGNWKYESASTVKQTFCINPQQPTISTGGSTEIMTLVSSSENGNQWFKDGEMITGEKSHKLTVTKSGIYVVVTTVEGCTSEPSAGYTVLITDLDNSQSKEAFLFPNPATEIVVFDASSINHGNGTQVQILDSSGRIVMEFNSIEPRFEVSVNSLVSGSYTLMATSQTGTLVRRFVRK